MLDAISKQSIASLYSFCLAYKIPKRLYAAAFFSSIFRIVSRAFSARRKRFSRIPWWAISHRRPILSLILRGNIDSSSSRSVAPYIANIPNVIPPPDPTQFKRQITQNPDGTFTVKVGEHTSILTKAQLAASRPQGKAGQLLNPRGQLDEKVKALQDFEAQARVEQGAAEEQWKQEVRQAFAARQTAERQQELQPELARIGEDLPDLPLPEESSKGLIQQSALKAGVAAAGASAALALPAAAGLAVPSAGTSFIGAAVVIAGSAVSAFAYNLYTQQTKGKKQNIKEAYRGFGNSKDALTLINNDALSGKPAAEVVSNWNLVENDIELYERQLWQRVKENNDDFTGQAGEEYNEILFFRTQVLPRLRLELETSLVNPDPSKVIALKPREDLNSDDTIQ